MTQHSEFWTADDTLSPEPVKVPEWGGGGEVLVAQLNADERDELEAQWGEVRDEEERGLVGFRAFVAAYCACDASNRRFFKETKAVHESALIIGRRNGRAVNRVFNAACRLNGLLKEDVEALEKNSDAAPQDDGSGE